MVSPQPPQLEEDKVFLTNLTLRHSDADAMKNMAKVHLWQLFFEQFLQMSHKFIKMCFKFVRIFRKITPTSVLWPKYVYGA